MLTGVTLPNINQLLQHKLETSLSRLSTLRGGKRKVKDDDEKKNIKVKNQDRGKGKQRQQRRRGRGFPEIILDMSLNLIHSDREEGMEEMRRAVKPLVEKQE